MPESTTEISSDGGPPRARGGVMLLLGAIVALLLAIVASLALGSRALSPGEVIGAIFEPSANPLAHGIVIDERLPRTLIGVVAGACLGLAGALMQSVTRNPIADPGLLGVSAGAALAVVLAIQFLGIDDPAAYVPFAFFGGLIAAVVVYSFASGGRQASPLRLALAGAALSALLGSFTTAVILLDRSTLDDFRFWSVGSLSGRELDGLAELLPFALVGMVVAFALAPGLNSLALGDEVAIALGHRVNRIRAAAALAAALLCGAAVAAAGPIAFVGLVAPHAARRIVGVDHRRLLPLSAVGGAVMLLIADVIGRLVAPPSEVQVGIVAALLGAPVLIWLVRDRNLVAT